MAPKKRVPNISKHAIALQILCLVVSSIEGSFGYTTSPRPPLSRLASRKSFIKDILLTTSSIGTVCAPYPASAGVFTPGGTLVDRDVGVTVGNTEASISRAIDNTNVLFTQDHYFKFGAAAPWIEPGTTDFPKSMPFTLSQQRYDALKKYGDRVKAGARLIDSLGEVIKSGGDDYASRISDASSEAAYALRPMGLLANGFMASENTGTTNELLLARWYINEIYLQIGDIRKANSEEGALQSYSSAKKAVNSYLGMLNRVITAKVGDKFEYLS